MKQTWPLLLLCALFSGATYADDTEIYVGNSNTAANPNVVFIFDTSGSMDYDTDECKTYKQVTKKICVRKDWWGDCVEYKYETVTQCDTYKSRLEVAQAAAVDTLNGLTGVNVGLMRYNKSEKWQGKDDGKDYNYRGGYLSSRLINIDEAGNKDKLKNLINAYSASGGTPLTESVHEAFNYFSGAPIDYARIQQRSTDTVTYAGDTNNARSDTSYVSPVVDQCQKNHIVLFTDGDSSRDGESNAQIRTWVDSLKKPLPSGLSTTCSSNGGGNTSITNSCLEELAYYMYAAKDQGKQNVQVRFHAIGGFLEGNSQTFLDKAASMGDGISASADSYDGLKTALKKIFDDINTTSGSYAAPAVAVNAFNSLEQLDQMYYSVFKPHASVGWSGNIKRFRLAQGGIVDASTPPRPAVDDVTGFFSKNARSYWTLEEDAPDGDSVTKGGMASRLTADRKVYTNLTGSNLTSSSNLVHENNTANVTKSSLGLSDTTSNEEHTKVLQWVRGLDSKGADPTLARRAMEDPLHGQPLLVNYGELTINGKKVPDSTLFIGTNSGYLHAFNTNENDPKELYSFIPKELLPVASAYYSGAGGKKYGLDGQVSLWHNDKNNNRIVDGTDTAYLYIGMRRGGSSYYGIDITNRTAPKMLGQINGKYHANGATAGFAKMGQTWSKAIPADMMFNNQKRKVLIFGGGYDPKEDNYSTRTAHEAGNAIYIVDPTTGELLWKASNESDADLVLPEMTSGIVGNIALIDNSSSGYVDLFYVADLGGRIWRIDFKKDATTSKSYATGGVIFDLGKDGSKSENVRFFTSLDVVYTDSFDYMLKDATTGQVSAVKHKPRYMLNIGSGYRAHPLDKQAIDNFYVLFDYNTETAPLSYTAVKKADLQGYKFVDNKINLTPSLKSNNGFYVELKDSDAGEKVLSKAITVDNVIYFSSFRPGSQSFDASCKPDTGATRLYAIKLTSPTDSVSIQDIKIPGIPSDPLIVTTPADTESGEEDGGLSILISTQLIDTGKKALLKKTYWRELK